MRALLAVLLTLVTTAAAAASQQPRLKVGTPYPDVRRQLRQQGFAPVTVLAADCKSPGESDEVCRFPEAVSCSLGRHYCAFLWRRLSDGRDWGVVTRGEADGHDFSRVTFDNEGPARPAHLDGLTIRLPDGRPFHFAYREPPEVTPTCAKSKGKQPCWVVPPPATRVRRR